MSQDQVVKSEGFYKRRKRVLQATKTSTVFKEYLAYLEDLLSNEREEYESNTATEFARGRVSLLKGLIDELKDGAK